MTEAPRIQIRDRSRTIVADVDYHRDLIELEAVLNFNAEGSWVLTVPADSPVVTLMQPGFGIVVSQDGEVVFSGDWDQSTAEFSGSGDTVEFSGLDDTGLLADRAIRPANIPLDAAGKWPYAGSGAIDQIAESVLHAFVTYQVGPTARPDLAIPGLVMGTDSGRGYPVTTVSRLDALIDVLGDVAARGGGLGFRCRQVGISGGRIEFQTYLPNDRTKLVAFSLENEALKTATVVTRAPSTNSVVAGGPGEAEQRIFAEWADTGSVSVWQRVIDLFSDQRGNATLDTLAATITEEIVKGGGGMDVTLALADSDSLRYGRDYDLGDRVRVVVGPYDVTGLVSRVTLGVGPGGVTVTPVVTTTGIAPRAARSSGGSGRALQQLQTSAEGFTPGMAMLWYLGISLIPSPWQLLDGTHGTPDFRDRFIVGAGGLYAQLSIGGRVSVDLVHHHEETRHGHDHRHTYAHTHPGHHAHAILAHLHPIPDHGHSVATHTHPIQTHDHTVPAHLHPIPTHNHLYDLTHDHGNVTIRSGGVKESGGSGDGALDTAVALVHSGSDAVARKFHTHDIDVNIPNYPMSNQGTGFESSGGSATDNNTTPANTGGTSGAVTSSNTTPTATGDATGLSTSNNTASGLATDPDTVVAFGVDAVSLVSMDATLNPASNTGDTLGVTSILPPYRAVYIIGRVA